MAGTDANLRLELWALATFRTVTFVLILALGLHLRGSLKAGLASLDTLPGSGLFLLLWATTLASTRFGRHYLRRAEIDPFRDPSRLEATIVAGAINGVAILVIVAVGFIARALPLMLGDASAVSILVGRLARTLVFLTIGGVAALIIGGFVGLAYGLVEGALLAGADSIDQKISGVQ